MKYRKLINGFVYYVFKVDQEFSVTIELRTHFQLLKGNIAKDSVRVANTKNVVLEYGNNEAFICYLTPGEYTLISASNMPTTRGRLYFNKSGYSKNDHAKFVQDLGLLHKGRTSANVKSTISCKTGFSSTDLIASPNTWHTFRAVGPAQIDFNNDSYQFELAQLL